jgi:hypothetical protein
MIGEFVAFFEEIKTLKSGFVVFILTPKKVKPLIIGLTKEGFSIQTFFNFSKKEASSLEALFFGFKKTFHLDAKKITELPEDWQAIVKTFSDKESSEFKVFKIEDLK